MGGITRLAVDRFELFVPLHQLWIRYMLELLGLGVPDSLSSHEGKMPSASSMHAKLVKADLIGALLTGEREIYLARLLATDPYRHSPTQVRQSQNPCLIGLSGIVLHETENAFKLITPKNWLKRTVCPHSFPVRIDYDWVCLDMPGHVSLQDTHEIIL